MISGSGRSPGEGSGNSPYCSCLGNPTDRGARRATVQSQTPPTTHRHTLKDKVSAWFCSFVFILKVAFFMWTVFKAFKGFYNMASVLRFG